MSKRENLTIKNQYDYLLEKGELLEMFPHFSGVWEKDKKEFSLMFDMNQDII